MGSSPRITKKSFVFFEQMDRGVGVMFGFSPVLEVLRSRELDGGSRETLGGSTVKNMVVVPTRIYVP